MSFCGPCVWEVVNFNNPSWSAWWKKKLLSCYAASMLVLLVIICLHQQIKNGSKQPGFRGVWSQVKHRNVDCSLCSIRPCWTVLLYWPVLLRQQSAVMPLPPCQHGTGVCLSIIWARYNFFSVAVLFFPPSKHASPTKVHGKTCVFAGTPYLVWFQQ